MAISKLIDKRDKMLKKLIEKANEKDEVEQKDSVKNIQKSISALQDSQTEENEESVSNEILKKLDELKVETNDIYNELSKAIFDFYSITEKTVYAILIPETEMGECSKTEFIDLHVANLVDANLVIDFFLTSSANSTESLVVQTVKKV
jgi:hypothetical protein